MVLVFVNAWKWVAFAQKAHLQVREVKGDVMGGADWGVWRRITIGGLAKHLACNRLQVEQRRCSQRHLLIRNRDRWGKPRERGGRRDDHVGCVSVQGRYALLFVSRLSVWVANGEATVAKGLSALSRLGACRA